jgi:hypothetical protein
VETRTFRDVIMFALGQSTGIRLSPRTPVDSVTGPKVHYLSVLHLAATSRTTKAKARSIVLCFQDHGLLVSEFSK